MEKRGGEVAYEEDPPPICDVGASDYAITFTGIAKILQVSENLLLLPLYLIKMFLVSSVYTETSSPAICLSIPPDNSRKSSKMKG